MKRTYLLLISAMLVLLPSCGIFNRSSREMNGLSNDSRIAIDRAEANRKSYEKQARRDINRSKDLIDRYEDQIKDLKRAQNQIKTSIITPKKEELKLRQEQLKRSEKLAKSGSYAAPDKREIRAMKAAIKDVKSDIKRSEKDLKSYDRRIKEVKKDIRAVKKNIKDSRRDIKDAKSNFKETKEGIILNDQINRVK